MLLSLALLTLLPGAEQRSGCAVAPDPYRASAVERPARLLNQALARGQFVELKQYATTATRYDSMAAQALGIQVRDVPPAVLASGDNLIAFVVDTAGAVVRCSIRFRLAVEDSAALIDRASRLRFSPARLATRPVPQLYVARLVNREDI